MNLTRQIFLLRLCVANMTKTVTSCNWVPSVVTEQLLDEYVQTGILVAKNIILAASRAK